MLTLKCPVTCLTLAPCCSPRRFYPEPRLPRPAYTGRPLPAWRQFLQELMEEVTASDVNTGPDPYAVTSSNSSCGPCLGRATRVGRVDSRAPQNPSPGSSLLLLKTNSVDWYECCCPVPCICIFCYNYLKFLLHNHNL